MNCRRVWSKDAILGKIQEKARDYENKGHWIMAALMWRKVGRIDKADWCEAIAQDKAESNECGE